MASCVRGEKGEKNGEELDEKKSEFLKHDVILASTKDWILVSTGVIIIDSNSCLSGSLAQFIWRS